MSARKKSKGAPAASLLAGGLHADPPPDLVRLAEEKGAELAAARAEESRRQAAEWKKSEEARLRLIAQAPALLIALRKLVESPVASTGDYILSEQDVAEARAVIAAAEDR